IFAATFYLHSMMECKMASRGEKRLGALCRRDCAPVIDFERSAVALTSNEYHINSLPSKWRRAEQLNKIPALHFYIYYLLFFDRQAAARSAECTRGDVEKPQERRQDHHDRRHIRHRHGYQQRRGCGAGAYC